MGFPPVPITISALFTSSMLANIIASLVVAFIITALKKRAILL